MEEILTNENPVLSIEIKYKKFISLSEFKESLTGWDNQYKKFVSQHSKEGNNDRLLIKKIRDGSIIVDVVSPMLPLLSDYNTVIAFFVSIKSLIDWLSTKIGKKSEIEHNEMIKSYTIVRPCNSMIQSI